MWEHVKSSRPYSCNYNNDIKNFAFAVFNFRSFPGPWHPPRNVDSHNHRSSIGNYYRLLIRDLKDTKQTSRFFRESQQHSKEIGNIILEACASKSSFGLCEFKGGRLTRDGPTILQVEDIGLAMEHLRSGYPALIQKRHNVEVELTGLYDEIAGKVNQFECAVITPIPPTIEAKEDDYSPEREL
jgi:hypothetical protein